MFARSCDISQAGFILGLWLWYNLLHYLMYVKPGTNIALCAWSITHSTLCAISCFQKTIFWLPEHVTVLPCTACSTIVVCTYDRNSTYKILFVSRTLTYTHLISMKHSCSLQICKYYTKQFCGRVCCMIVCFEVVHLLFDIIFKACKISKWKMLRWLPM